MRPQWVLYGHSGHLQGQGWCVPIAAQLGGERFPRKDFVYYDEVGNFRITINRANELEIRNTKDGELRQLRIIEDLGQIRLDTPKTHIQLKDDDGSITIECTDTATIHCKDAVVNADQSVSVKAGTTAEVQAGSDATVEAAGNVNATAAGQVNVTAGGQVSVTGALISLNG